jgi:hypothetical protein
MLPEGSQAPDFALETVEGEHRSLSKTLAKGQHV